jgi:hypothetical protein
MAKRRRFARGLAGAAIGAGEGMQDALGLMMRRYLNEENAVRTDALMRGRTADENVTKGDWSPEQAASYRRGQMVEPSVSQRLGSIFEGIGKAGTVETTPTKEQLVGELKAKRVPLTGFGQTAKFEGDDETLPSTQFGPVQSQPARDVFQAREAKLRAFPPTKIGEEMVGEGDTLQSRAIFGKANQDTGQIDRVQDFPMGPQAGQKGSFEGVVGAQKEVEERGEKIQTEVEKENALRPGRIQTAAGEANARQQAELAAAVRRAAMTGGLLPEQEGTALKLATDFAAQSKDFFTLQRQFNQVAPLSAKIAQGGKLSPAEDISLVYTYMKALSPESTVMQGEYAKAENTKGLPDWVVQSYNKALQGNPLSPQQEQMFLGETRRLYERAVADHKDRSQFFTVQANQRNIPANLVVREPTPGLELIGQSKVVNGRRVTVVDVTPDGQLIVE